MPTKSKNQGGPKGVNSGSRLGVAQEVANVRSPTGLGTTDVAIVVGPFRICRLEGGMY